jgi:hypothetical protein
MNYGNYVSLNSNEETLPLEKVLVRLEEAKEEHAEADRTLREVLAQFGLKDAGSEQNGNER